MTTQTNVFLRTGLGVPATPLLVLAQQVAGAPFGKDRFSVLK